MACGARRYCLEAVRADTEQNSNARWAALDSEREAGLKGSRQQVAAVDIAQLAFTTECHEVID